MKQLSVMKRTAIIILCAVIAIAFSAAVPGAGAFAGTKYKLPTKIVQYNKYDGVWTQTGIFTYKYNKKGDAVQIDMCLSDGEVAYESHRYTLKHTYKKGKKVKTVIKVDGKLGDVFTFDKKGRITSHTIKKDAYGYTSKNKYKYGKKGYLKSIKGSNARKYKTSLKKGKATKIIRTWDDRGALVKDVFEYRGDELLKKRTHYYADALPETMKYSYEKKGGLVTRRYIVSEDPSVDGVETQREDISYGNTTATAKKYAKIINGDERTITGTLFHFWW